MAKENPKPRWKRALRLVLKIYCALCTVLFTLWVSLAIRNDFLRQESVNHRPYQMTEDELWLSYGMYMAKEYPKRGNCFQGLAMILGRFAKFTNVPEKDLFSYLGKPDLFEGTNGFVEYVYFYHQPANTNRWAVFANVKGGKLSQVGINAADVNDLSDSKPYVPEEDTNKIVPAVQPK